MRTSWMMVFMLATGLSACKKDKEADAPPKAPDLQEAPNPQETRNPEPAEPEPPEPPAANLADIGIKNATTPADHVVAGGQVTDEQLAKAKELGVKTIVNLRTESEKAEYETEKAKAEELGMTYVHIPIDGRTGEGLTPEAAKKLAAIVDEGEPTVVHCKSGQRVGALFAMKAHHVDGKSPDEAMQVGAQAGLSMPELVKLVGEKMAAK